MAWRADITAPSCEAVITALLLIVAAAAAAGGPPPGEPDRHQHAESRGRFSTVRAAGSALFAKLDHLDDPAMARLEWWRSGSLRSAWTGRPSTRSSGRSPVQSPLTSRGDGCARAPGSPAPGRSPGNSR